MTRLIECALALPHGRRKCRPARPEPPEPMVLPTGRVPRVARLLALAHKFDQLVREGGIADYACLARVGHVSRPRITQIMNLMNLAPDIQDEILFLPRTEGGRDIVHIRQLQPIAALLNWQDQRRRWQELLQSKRNSMTELEILWSKEK